MLEIFATYQVQVFARTVVDGTGSEIVSVTTDQDSKLMLINVMVMLPSTHNNVTM